MTNQPIRTISDIAELAGVSKSTVSRALQDSPLISAKTKLRIHEIAQQHNFRLQHAARMLSLQRTQTIAFVVPTDPARGRTVSDPFNMELIGAVAETLHARDYDLLLAQSAEGDTAWVERLLRSRRVDGVITMDCNADPATFAALVEEELPFIVWGKLSAEIHYPTVTSDDFGGGRMVGNHLLEQGRKRIAFIGGNAGELETMQRLNGLRKAVGDAAIVAVRYGDYSSESGFVQMEDLLNSAESQSDTSHFDAVFVGSDIMAIGAMEALRAANRTIPDDVAVVGFDGIDLTAHCSPPLTTVRQRVPAAGKLLAENLLQFIDNGIVTNTTLPVELIARFSTVGSG